MPRSARSARSPRARRPRTTGRRPSRGSSAARSSRRRPRETSKSMPPAALVASMTVSAPSSPCTRAIGRRDAGRGLVVRPRVHVDALDRLGRRAGAGGRLAHVGCLQPRRFGGGGELAAELAEDEVLAAVLDQAEGGGIPERGRSAVADDDLVALREARNSSARCERTSPTRSLHGRLTVRGAEQRRAAGRPAPRAARRAPSTGRIRSVRRRAGDHAESRGAASVDSTVGLGCRLV